MTKTRKKQYTAARAYLIGIKGVGMTALAQHLASRGFRVSGSDTNEKFFTDAVLKRHHIPFTEEFSARNVPGDVRFVVASSAYTAKNPEVKEARKRGYKIFSYAHALGELFNEKHGIAVCGSHGKTTTSALLGYVFQKAEKRPNVMTGSEVPQFRGNALMGSGEHFIAEADEYQNKFRFFDPKTILLTNIDYDHPDYFSDVAAYRRVFRNFIGRLPKSGLLVVCSDDAEARKILPATRAKIITYGLDEDYFHIRAHPVRSRTRTASATSNGVNKNVTNVDVHWIAREVKVKNGRWQFNAYRNNELFGSFFLRIPGRHNVLNALGVIAASRAHGIKKDIIQRALREFRGTRRRFEYKGIYHGALLIDDYAHHPAEIKATLKAARELYPKKRIIAVFHPHTYTRTKALLGDFAKSFSDADEVIVLDIYGSAREKQGGVSSKELVKRASVWHKHIRHIATIPRAVLYFKKRLKKGDVLIAMGAGDVWKVHKGLVPHLSR
ncbi:MAG: UDP-N-acetylmuramate--L-alanine ligase [bacterium]|nr:UDP-N-acetylmuramate--L-alanine ligase [bacterium]